MNHNRSIWKCTLFTNRSCIRLFSISPHLYIYLILIILHNCFQLSPTRITVLGGKILIWKITRTHLNVHMCLLSSTLHIYVMSNRAEPSINIETLFQLHCDKWKLLLNYILFSNLSVTKLSENNYLRTRLRND